MQTSTANKVGKELTVEEKIQKIREAFADGPEIPRTALEKSLAALKLELAAPSGRQNAGRIGARQGAVSELTMIIPLAAGGAQRLRTLLKLLDGNFQLADQVGTVHDMRFVFLDNDTKLLFATAYDGDWDPYIEDFASKIPNALDMLLGNGVGYPGLLSPSIKEWIVKHQINADGWYVGNPNLTVAETRRLERVGKAVEEFLDKIG
jgi:hypothetical protein